jgi:hypothetical protein
MIIDRLARIGKHPDRHYAAKGDYIMADDAPSRELLTVLEEHDRERADAEQKMRANQTIANTWIRDEVRPAFSNRARIFQRTGRVLELTPKPAAASFSTQPPVDLTDYSRVHVKVGRGLVTEFRYELQVSAFPKGTSVLKRISDPNTTRSDAALVDQEVNLGELGKHWLTDWTGDEVFADFMIAYKNRLATFLARVTLA